MKYFFTGLITLLLTDLPGFGQISQQQFVAGTTQADSVGISTASGTKTDSLPVTAKSSSVADTLAPATAADDLLAGLADSTDTQPLLPAHMLFTQRAFWGPKGLLRVMKVVPLTTENRRKELSIRRTMLIAHQIGGFVTLAGFVAQGFLGAKLYNARGETYTSTKQWHNRAATFINVSYGTTLALSLFAPPPIIGSRRGFNTIKLHKYLAVVHLAGMVATNVLAGMIQDNYKLKPYHRAAAYTTFATYAVSVIALKF